LLDQEVGSIRAMMYVKFFPGIPPARSTVQAVLPNDAALVEIDVVALQ
jgi:enamine deaminase RidA (YjgF/YER057c/UK114 family)